jgi:hypothetical protein
MSLEQSRVLVYQSYDSRRGLTWVKPCMDTVRSWARSRGYDYEAATDPLDAWVPAWYADRARSIPRGSCGVADLARLEMARRHLGRGYGHVIWVDADVLVFDPAGMEVPLPEQFAFCKEVWTDRFTARNAIAHAARAAGLLRDDRTLTRVNNSVSVFAAGNHLLDFYADACREIVRQAGDRLSPIDVGTRFLTRLYHAVPFPLVTTVGMLSPVVLRDVSNGGGSALRHYVRAHGHPLAAANLCLSYLGTREQGITMDDGLYERAVRRLMESRGWPLLRPLRAPDRGPT